MEERVEIEEKAVSNVTFYNIPLEDGQELQKLLRDYKGNSGRLLIKEMLNRYHLFNFFSMLFKEIEELRKRVDELENKRSVKTLRGEI